MFYPSVWHYCQTFISNMGDSKYKQILKLPRNILLTMWLRLQLSIYFREKYLFIRIKQMLQQCGNAIYPNSVKNLAWGFNRISESCSFNNGCNRRKYIFQKYPSLMCEQSLILSAAKLGVKHSTTEACSLWASDISKSASMQEFRSTNI